MTVIPSPGATKVVSQTFNLHRSWSFSDAAAAASRTSAAPSGCAVLCCCFGSSHITDRPPCRPTTSRDSLVDTARCRETLHIKLWRRLRGLRLR